MTSYTAAHPLVIQIATHYNLRADLLAAQIQAESSGDAFAFRYEHEFFDRYISDKPAAAGYKYGPLAACSYGLLQVLLETALEYGFQGSPWELFTPRVGLSYGAIYLQRCLERSGHDYRKALVRYNGSGGRAEAYASRVFAIRDQQGSG